MEHIKRMATDLGGKLVELLVEIAPGMKHVGVVRNPNNPGVTLLLRETEKAIGALGLRLEVGKLLAEAFAHWKIAVWAFVINFVIIPLVFIGYLLTIAASIPGEI